MTVTIRFYGEDSRLLETQEVEAEASPDLRVSVPPAPAGAVRFVATWPQQSGDSLAVLAKTVQQASVIHWE